jgi:hypothetical protein
MSHDEKIRVDISFTFLKNCVKLFFGSLHYLIWRFTPNWAYQSMIGLFCATGGASNDLLSRFLSRLHPPREVVSNEGILGSLHPRELSRIVTDLDKNGYHIFENRLPAEICDRLLQFALTNRCSMRAMTGLNGAETSCFVEYFPRDKPERARYDFEAQDVIDNHDVQRIMADHSFIKVAQAYLRCQPVIDVMSMWWHTAFSKSADPDAAQFWHFDMDRIKWLKFFIYLTDVGPTNGPHSFVVGSHRSGGIPKKLLNKGYSRLTDPEVEANYPSERIVEFAAPRGTIIAEDTRGLHKGKHVLSDDRLILQLQFSNSLFGGYYPPSNFSPSLSNPLKESIQRFPRIYSNYWH